MDGIINVLKPPGMTSFDVVALLRGITGIRKVGHAGTLDPMAAGVLPVCAGRATKAVEFLADKEKLYRTELTLGIATDTQDTTGRILSSSTPDATDNQIEEAISSFEGKYNQLPPMHSAIRIDGKRLYELAREGVEIERKKREVEIYSVKVIHIDRTDGVKVLIDVHCSKGTYIRTLCADIGERLGCGGCMSFLLRLRAGPFDILDSVTLEELARRREEGTIKEIVAGVDRIFSNLENYVLDEETERKFRNGMHIPLRNNDAQGGIMRVYGSSGDFIAIGTIINTKSGKYLKVRKFF